jgi:hypothetical protein
MPRRNPLVFVLIGSLLIGGCASGVPKDALALSAESLQRRGLQTRKFDTIDEAKLLSAAVGLIQDLGFTIEGTQAKLGLVTGSKQRDATDGGQVAAAVAIAILLGVSTSVDEDQTIRVSIVTRSSGQQTSLRVTFQRAIRNTSGQTTRLEFIADEDIYQEFFQRLSKAVFLEAQKI